LSELPRFGLTGNLRLVCRHDPARGTFLAEQAFSAPIHLSKSYWDGEILLVNVVNQTAGIFGGDAVTSHVVVEAGARVLLSSPSAARFHPSHGREARLDQAIEIRAGGSLDVFPEITIPQRDSRSFQKTTIDIEPGGELIFQETLAPGRVASGEAFAFSRYAWSTDIRVGRALVLRERASIVPGDLSLAGLCEFFPTSYYLSIVLISPGAAEWGVGFSHAVAASAGAPEVKVAASRLSAGGWAIRVLAANSLALRESNRKLRQLIYTRLGRRLPDARRNASPLVD
jgi:urease accessory protein